MGREALLDKCIKIIDDFTYSVIRRREAEIVEARESGRKKGVKNGHLPLILNYAVKYPILKVFNKMLLFLKLDINKIELKVELDNSKVEFYAYFAT